MPLRPNTYTYTELLQNIKRTFGDESGVQLDEADVLRWANEGLQNIVARNRVLRAKATSVTVAGSAEYTFPDVEIYQVSAFELDGQLLPNVPFEDAELRIMAADPDRLEQGRPLFWYVWDETFTLWPTPDAAYPVVLRYVRIPTKLTGTDVEVIDMPDKYYPALVDYILSKCYEMDEDWQAQGAKIQAYEGAIATHGEEERSAQEMSYPVVREVDYLA